MQIRTMKVTLVALIIGAIIAASTAIPGPTAFAQARTSFSTEPAASRSLRWYLEKLDYDASGRGPLLAVATDDTVDLSQQENVSNAGSRLSLATLARLTERKVVTTGGLRVLVPMTMKVIESHPGKANLYRGLSKEDAVQFLMGTFTADQWQTACSPAGIGLSDLREDQKRFLVGMLPGKVAILDKPNADGAPGGVEDVAVPDPENVRLRLNLLAHYSTPDDSGITGGSGFAALGSGDPVGLLFRSERWRNEDGLDDHTTAAFGVRLVRIVPNRQKTSQIDYSWPQLDRAVRPGAPGGTSTVGEIIERVARATRLDIVCDRRASGLPIYFRGDSARAGDLLQAIALAVTGTYRRIGATPAWVLTDDIEGMGTRTTRIAAWAGQADDERKKLLAAAAAHAAKLNPFAYLSFGPNDPLKLPAGIKDSLLDEYRKGADDIAQLTRSSDLPATYRADINRNYETWVAANGTAADISKVRLGMDVAMSFIIPGVGPVLDPLNRAEHEMRRLAEPTPRLWIKKASAAPMDWKWLTAAHQKRVLLIAPRTIADATSLTAAAGRHGFTEAWLKVEPDSPALKGDESVPIARSLLEAAIAAGMRAHIAVGADISLLRSDREGTPERNIFGQTGEEFADAQVAQPANVSAATETDEADADPDDSGNGDDTPRDRFANWRSSDSAGITRRIETIADIPGLAGIVLQQTTPPGFIGDDDKYSVVQAGGELGFTDDRRFAFLHKTGYDPIDVIGESDDFDALDLDQLALSLPFFADDGKIKKTTFEGDKLKEDPIPESPRALWNSFRETENSQMIGTVYRSFQALHPKMPLWIDDRSSDYANVSPWFGTLDDPAQLPKHATDGDTGAADREAARAASKTVLLCARPPMSGPFASRPDAFVSRTGARSVAEGWNGIVIDVSHMPADSALDLLQKMPSANTGVGSASVLP